MAENKFEFTVSGVELTPAQKNQISEEIGVAVSRILAGMHGDGAATARSMVSGPAWHVEGINGGRRWLGKDASAITKALVDAKLVQQPAMEAMIKG